MPTYSYRCTECGTSFDIQQAFTDGALTECPSCGGRLRKLYGSVGVTFNGSGFYRTDSRAGASSASSDSSASSSGSSTVSSSGASSGASATSTSGGSGSGTAAAAS